MLDPRLTRQDRLVLQSLLQDVEKKSRAPFEALETACDSGYSTGLSSDEDAFKISKQGSSGTGKTTSDGQSIFRLPQDLYKREGIDASHDIKAITQLQALNNPKNKEFTPTVFLAWDIDGKNDETAKSWLLNTYITAARHIVRSETDVVMLTHLILYSVTSLPSAWWLYRHFSYTHGVLHSAMQVWFAGSYTLMMHQHIHMGGILNKRFAWFDRLFPYIADPLMGHTWNSYYFHHVKHHHVEGNGPNDLSSTLRYQRDDIWHFLHYVCRFFLLVWIDLPLYFLQKGQTANAAKTAFFELGSYLFLYIMAAHVNLRATIFVYLIPLFIMRIGLMIGNWGQHAFVDETKPDSDYRSSITLIDVASNRFCFNDGYHTSHHLNPRRHWRDHPVAFLQQKRTYARESALVFQNIDYLMITLRLMMKDYEHLAKCLVPMGEQIGMSLTQIAEMLERKTRRFTEEEIGRKFKQAKSVRVDPASDVLTIN
ncbi:hypothetical protein MMC25_001195 [Agyrium rufum]|nr:hypothetical protein [Agyrium rufum]